MKILRKTQSKVIVLGITLVLLMFSLFYGVQFSRVLAEDTPDESDIVYIDTEVEGIAFVQHPTCVFFGFRLTESDYDDFGLWEGDYRATPTQPTYNKYITQDLTYWKNFSQNNSDGVRFDQDYAYWHGSSVGPAQFANTVTHRSTLERLVYGFIITIPEGTTFPSATYVNGKCEGAPIMYRTTENKAFCYDGTSFTEFPYQVAVNRNLALKELGTVNYELYYEAEREDVQNLVSDAVQNIQSCLTNVAVQDVMSEFYTRLDKIMTIANYEELIIKKQDAKSELALYFEAFLQDDYDESGWNTILKIKNEYGLLIDTAKNKEEVLLTVASVKLATEKVLTKNEQVEFEQYRASAIERVDGCFDETLYRETERLQGERLVQEAKEQLEKATTYDDVDGWCLGCLSQIDALKTKAQWEAEEREQEQDKEENTESDSSNLNQTEDAKKDDFKYVVLYVSIGLCAIIAVIVPIVVINKKRKGKKNEE